MASFKIPRHVLILDEFPMTPSGKIRKVELRSMAIDRLGDAIAAEGIPVQVGEFGEHMMVEIANDGPVTLILERNASD